MIIYFRVLLTLVLFSTSHGFFLSSLASAIPTNPISCYAGLYIEIENLYTTSQSPVGIANQAYIRLCAIREDTAIYNGSNYVRRTYIASNITNTLRPMVRSRCQGFSNTSDIGYGSCVPRPFELYNATTLCICATDFCNRDFSTCQQSIASSNPPPPLAPQVVPVLTTPIRCYDNTQTNSIPGYGQSNYSHQCIPRTVWSPMSSNVYSKPIDYAMCNTYVQANSVLCRVRASSALNNNYYYYYYSNSAESWNEYWSGAHLMAYTAEEYIEDILALLADNTPLGDNQYYYYYNTEVIFNYELFEGPTNFVVRRVFYDLAGNRLGLSTLNCFCSTDNCNSDFDTCATGINYNTTGTTFTAPTRTSSSSTAATASMTTSRGTRSTSSATLPTITSPPMAFFAFDGNAADMFSSYNGSLVGGATFTNNGYVRRALLLAQTSQYVQTGFINLAHQSFTVSGWFSTTTTTQNATIFSECPSRVARKCLTLGIFNRRLSMDFFGGFNTTGSTVVSTSRWFHVAFVYDEMAQQQLIYLNGIEDGQSTAGAIPPYLGTCQSVRIGANFIGSVDHLIITDRAKSPNEVLTEATLVAAYSFEGNLSDSGPNGFNGTGAVNFGSNGHSGQSLTFNNNGAVFQTTGLTVFTITNQSFSISLWLKPVSNVSQNNFLTLSATNWCMPLLGFSASSKLLFKLNGVATSGGVLSTLVWTHVVYTYSTTNGAQLFINGVLVQNMYSVFPPSSSTVTLSVGTQISPPSPCVASSGRYEGLIDELKIYSRELSADDVNDLTNA